MTLREFIESCRRDLNAIIDALAPPETCADCSGKAARSPESETYHHVLRQLGMP